MSVALSSGGGGAMATGGSGALMMPPPMLNLRQQQQQLPGGRADVAPRGVVGTDVSKPQVESDELAHGGDACLCVEFSGATVCAAAWEAKKREAVGLPVGTDGSSTGCASMIEVNASSELRAWLAKPPKARAAEVHTSGCVLGADGGTSSSRLKCAGLALGALSAQAAASIAGDQGWVDREPEASVDEDEDEGVRNLRASPLMTSGSRTAKKLDEQTTLSPEEACALLIARPRQRATQLVAKPVRRLVIVAPATATQAWRLAAMEACAKIDARCVRMVSAAAALALCKRLEVCANDDLTSNVLIADCCAVPGSKQKVVVDMAAGRVSRNGVAIDWVERSVADDLEAAIRALAARDADASLIVRGAPDDVALPDHAMRATPMEAVVSAAQLRASELALPGAPVGLSAYEALPLPVSAARIELVPGQKIDDVAAIQSAEPLFERLVSMPSSVRKTYDRSSEHETLFALVEQGQPCGTFMEDPFETVDDDGEVVLARAATVEYKLDKRGLVSAQVIHADAPKSKAREDRERSQRRCKRIGAALTALFFLTPIFYTLIHMRTRAVTRRQTIDVVEDFYARAAPEKIAEAAIFVDKYEGFEEILFKRLELRYPGFKVRRPDSTQGSPDQAAKESTTEL